MNKYILAALLLGLSAPVLAAGGNSYNRIDMQTESYSDTGYQLWLPIVMNSTTTVANVVLPPEAKGLILYPRTNTVQYSVNQSGLTSLGSNTTYSTTISSASLKIGGFAKNDQYTTRLLPAVPRRILHMMPLTAGTTVDVEVF